MLRPLLAARIKIRSTVALTFEDVDRKSGIFNAVSH